jgi:hypothetical protein
VIVLVGPEEQPFSVYKDIICASSKFFKAACSERWIEGKEKKVRLPEVKPSVFQGYIAWLCSGHYQMQASRGDPLDVINATTTAMIEMYILGDVLDDIRFRNKMMERLVSRNLGCCPQITTICMLWERTTTMSPLRKMHVKVYILRVDRPRFARRLRWHFSRGLR